jgi:hypothetical protein
LIAASAGTWTLERSREDEVGNTRRAEEAATQEDSLWAYAYQMLPSRAAHRTKGIRALLEGENREAKRADRNWTARLVLEQHVTHVLIVSDTPELDRDINRRLEARLKEMEVRFAVTVPMPVVEQARPEKEQE